MPRPRFARRATALATALLAVLVPASAPLAQTPAPAPASPAPAAPKGPAGRQAPRARLRPALAPAAGQWTPARARAWADSVGWLVGSNFLPSTASNELEMWQAATWDPTTIDRELGYAESLGMNTMRVFLHDLAYRRDPQGFLRRVDQFLAMADRHKIRPMLVLFDACWNPFPRAGRQPEPYPHLHNSRWVQSPGVDILVDTASHERLLGPYVRAVVGRFARDRRVLAWDVMNEPDNINRTAYFAFEPLNKGDFSLALMQKSWRWAKGAGATQPLTAAPWKGDYADTTKILPISNWMLEHSDVITFHSYDRLERTRELVDALRRYDRPIINTEYMARPNGSTFETHLPYFAEAGVGAINWGFVNGRSQTIYPWDSWTREYTGPPPVWFHDVWNTDGTPYRAEETALIKRVAAERAGKPLARPAGATSGAQ